MKTWTLIFLIAAGGFVLRAWDLNRVGLNSDEATTARLAFHQDRLRFEEDVHPPLYLLSVRILGRIVPGPVETKARAASVVAGTLLIVLLAWCGFLAAGRAGALAAALLVAFDPGLIVLARMARGYAVSALILGALFPLSWEVIRNPDSRKRLLLCALVNALALYTFYYAFFLCAAQLAVAALIYRRNRRGALSLAAACVLGILAFLPFAPTLLEQAGRVLAGTGWTHWPFTGYEIMRRGIQVFITHSPFSALSLGAYGLGKWSGAVLSALMAATILISAWTAVRRRGADLAGFALAKPGGEMGLGLPVTFILVVFLSAMTAHAIGGVFVGFAYFSFLAPPVMVVVILALDRGWGNAFAPAIIAVILATHLLGLPGTAGANREDLREAVRDFDAQARPGAMAMTCAHFIKDAFIVYSERAGPFVGLPADLPGHRRVTRESPAFMDLGDRRGFFQALGSQKEIWLILSHETRQGRDRCAGLARRWLSEGGAEKTRQGAGRSVRWEKYER